MITIIACVDNDWGIGKDNQLLVKIPQDMKHFKNHTVGNVCVFGRKTAESLPHGKPLPNRRNIIMTRNLENSIDGFESSTDVKYILDLSKEHEVYICGGAEIYELFMPYTDRIILTSLSQSYDADTYFPHISMYNWLMNNMNEGLSVKGKRYTDIRLSDRGKHDNVNYIILEYSKGDTKVD